MKPSQHNETDGGVLPPSVNSPISYLTGLFNILGGLWTFLLMLLICADVLARAAFNHPIAGVPEIVAFSIVCIVFLQLGRTAELGRIMRADTFQTMFERISPRLNMFISVLAELGGAVLVFIIIYGVWPRMMSDYEAGYFIGTPGIFTFPSWPLSAVVIAGAAVAGIHFVLRAAHALLCMLKPALPKGAA